MTEANKNKVSNVAVMASSDEKHIIVDSDIHAQAKAQAALRKKSLKDYIKGLLDDDKQHL